MSTDTPDPFASLRSVLQYGPMTAGHIGLELWGCPESGRPENIDATRFCRPAGKLLRRAQQAGIVTDHQRGHVHFWMLT
jgi:hypothetical protein